MVFRALQRHLAIKLSRAQIKVRAEIADEALAAALDYETGALILAQKPRRPFQHHLRRAQRSGLRTAGASGMAGY